MNTLENVKIGEIVRVKGLDKESTVKRKLLDMGVTPGVSLKVVSKAPMGDPISIELRGYKLTLRKEEAKAILIQ
ncbi:MAG: FeoA family protein [Sarcina sp.]